MISVVKVKRVSERIMTLKPDIKRSILNVVSVRVPEVLEEKGIVNEDGQSGREYPLRERLMIGGDFNRKVKGTEVIRRKHGNGFCQQHGNVCDERGTLDNA